MNTKQKIFALICLVSLFAVGCKKDKAAEKAASDAETTEKLVDTWQTDVYQIDGVNAKTEVRFSVGKITKVVLSEQNGKFAPYTDSEGNRDSKTYFFKIKESNGKKLLLDVSEDIEIPEDKTFVLTLTMIDENSMEFAESDDENILLKREVKN